VLEITLSHRVLEIKKFLFHGVVLLSHSRWFDSAYGLLVWFILNGMVRRVSVYTLRLEPETLLGRLLRLDLERSWDNWNTHCSLFFT
jgi:hypothetical protein